MDKKYWHHLWIARIRPIKLWYIAVLLAGSLLLFAFGLRSNYQQMDQLRTAVYQADEQNGDTEAALQALQRYVTSHMNTSLTADSSIYPPIQLKYTYQRLQEQAIAQANASQGHIYSDAQSHCEAQNPADFSGRTRVPCIAEYVKNHGGVPPQTVPESMYKFNFASPSWSPDLAGWSLVLSILLAIAFIIRLFLGWILPKISK